MYNITDKTTAGFCDNFPVTSSKFNSIIEPKPGKSEEQGDFRCLTSILTIADLIDTDFGLYQCNVTGIKNNATGNISLLKDDDAGPDLPAKVIMFEDIRWAYPSYTYSLQCVTYGSKALYWFISTCEQVYNCPPETTYAVVDIKSSDKWWGFDQISIKYHPSENVVESFLWIKDLAITDRIKVFCSFENKPNITSYHRLVGPTNPDSGSDSAHLYYVVFFLISLSTLGCLFTVLLLVFGIAACFRAQVFRRRHK